MTTITIEGCVYKVHPVYDLYAASEDGRIINIVKQIPRRGNENNSGYLMFHVRKHGQSGRKIYCAHRFVWECFNGVISDEKEIDHVNNNKKDNHLCNLQLLAHKQNQKKMAKDRDFSYFSQKRKNRKCVKATNEDTEEIIYFNNTYAVKQHLNINRGTVNMICGCYYGFKSGKSKKDGCSYTFEYVKEEDLPANYIKSLNIRPKRVSEKDKKKRQREWWKKEYICPKCSKVMKNDSKYKHNKKCK